MKFQLPDFGNIGTIERTHISQEKGHISQDILERPSQETEKSNDTIPAGVKRIEATTQVWTKKALVLTYIRSVSFFAELYRLIHRQHLDHLLCQLFPTTSVWQPSRLRDERLRAACTAFNDGDCLHGRRRSHQATACSLS